jgi:hypothetical protein
MSDRPLILPPPDRLGLTITVNGRTLAVLSLFLPRRGARRG